MNGLPFFNRNTPYVYPSQPRIIPPTQQSSNPNVIHMETKEAKPLCAEEQQKFDTIIAQIKQFSEKSYQVSIKRFTDLGLFNPAVSCMGTVVILDDRLMAFPIEVIAFAVGHEWAHNLLNHDRLRQARRMNSNEVMAQEDEADCYAIKFMVAHGYGMDEVYKFNTKVNNEGGQPNAGIRRNAKLKTAYEAALSGVQVGNNAIAQGSGNVGFFNRVSLVQVQPYYFSFGYN